MNDVRPGDIVMARHGTAFQLFRELLGQSLGVPIGEMIWSGRPALVIEDGGWVTLVMGPDGLVGWTKTMYLVPFP